MRARALILLFTAILPAVFASRGFAHHSISAEFDEDRRVNLSGTVPKIAWTNPHTIFYVDVKDQKTGSIINWTCVLGSPNMLADLGWTPSTLKSGMAVNFMGILARDGSHKVIAKNIVADGNKIIAWPSEQYPR